MDPMIAKTIVSRRKSIAVLSKEIEQIRIQRERAGSPGAVVVLQEMLKLREARKAKLEAEVAALESLGVDERQLEVPGTAPGAPARPGPGRK